MFSLISGVVVSLYVSSVASLRSYDPTKEVGKCPQLVVTPIPNESGDPLAGRHLYKVNFTALTVHDWIGDWEEFGFEGFDMGNYTDTSFIVNRTIAELITYYDFQSGHSFYQVAEGELHPSEEDVSKLWNFFAVVDQPTDREIETEVLDYVNPTETEILAMVE